VTTTTVNGDIQYEANAGRRNHCHGTMATVRCRAMSGFAKGGLFVGGAVAVGLLAGFLLQPLVAGSGGAEASRSGAPRLPAMPDVVGLPLEEAEAVLSRRDIAHATDDGDVFGVVIPSVWEVCETEPAAGERVRGSAHLRAALPGTCGIS